MSEQKDMFRKKLYVDTLGEQKIQISIGIEHAE